MKQKAFSGLLDEEVIWKMKKLAVEKNQTLTFFMKEAFIDILKKYDIK